MRRVLLALTLILSTAAQGGPIYTTPADSNLPGDPTTTADSRSANIARSDRKGIAGIKLRGMTPLGQDFAASALAARVKSPEENLAITKGESENPADWAVEPEFFAAIGLDPAGLAQNWGKGDALTSFDKPFTSHETFYENEVQECDDKCEEREGGGAFARTFFSFKLKGDDEPALPPIPWMHDLLSKIHDFSNMVFSAIYDNRFALIGASGAILVLIRLLRDKATKAEGE
jgi:hypothetical protein